MHVYNIFYNILFNYIVSNTILFNKIVHIKLTFVF